jgi:hypothetical protein
MTCENEEVYLLPLCLHSTSFSGVWWALGEFPSVSVLSPCLEQSYKWYGASLASHRLGVEGLETAEGSSCGSSDDDDDREATPGTSGVSCSAPQDDSGCDEMAAEGSCSSPRVVVLNSDSVSPAKPHSLVTDTGKGTPEGCTELGEASMDKHRVEKEGGEAEDPCRRQKAESHQPREKDAASTVLNKDRETEKMTGGDRAAQVEPGEDRADLPAARLEGSQAGNSVSTC